MRFLHWPRGEDVPRRSFGLLHTIRRRNRRPIERKTAKEYAERGLRLS